ncbi:AMIN domain-containing protein [Hyalangium gracile]|uniref:AMIN domain-containing protein n=1 Tax=Hyalangium gracile TaxID=394092 RepID=UPI001CCCB7ED|nr:AMIN domain-containing protein [Hyalangium gracile]
MRSLAVFMLGWVLVPLLAFAQEKVELNTITGVKVNGSTVEITGTKKPNFTTFTMTDPPRLVIDISEAILKGVPEETRVTSGLITGLRSANYGSDSAALARVLIGYDREVETDIQVTGNVLMVRVLEGGGPLVAQVFPGPEQSGEAATGPTAAEAQAGANQATVAAQQDRAAQEKAAADSAAAAQQDRAAQEKAQADATAAAKQAEEDRRKQEEAARAEAAKKAEDERRAQELAAAEDKKRQQEIARAEEEARKQAAAEEKKRKEAEARAEAEVRKQQEADEKKRKAEEAEQKRLAALEEKKRRAEEARAEVEARKQQEADEKKRKAEEAEQKRLAALEEKKRRAEEAEQKRLAQAEPKPRDEGARPPRVAAAEPPRREEPESPSAGSVSGRRGILEIVGFQQRDGGSRVYVRTSEPVSYKVSEGRNEIVLMLENTQIGKGNNTRALDTSFFDTAVTRVDPTVGPDRSVRVSIKLKEQVPVQTRQEGNTISLEFARPSR